jgi:hypothetical protein
MAGTGFHPLFVTPWGSDLLVLPKESIKRKFLAKSVVNRGDVFTTDAIHVKKELSKWGVNPENIHIN